MDHKKIEEEMFQRNVALKPRIGLFGMAGFKIKKIFSVSLDVDLGSVEFDLVNLLENGDLNATFRFGLEGNFTILGFGVEGQLFRFDVSISDVSYSGGVLDGALISPWEESAGAVFNVPGTGIKYGGLIGVTGSIDPIGLLLLDPSDAGRARFHNDLHESGSF